jgi:hypothetical protein
MHPHIQEAEHLETYIQFVYQTLLDLKGEHVHVARRSKVSGKSGAWYEIDVYYAFERAGIPHRVAFECKHWNRKIDRDAIIAFHGKLDDIGNIQGAMISRVGFQSGARDYAAYHGIDLRTLDDLPGFVRMLGMRVAAVALPHPDKRGEPFWAIMNAHGLYWSVKGPDEKHVIPLFISKVDARRACDRIPSKEWLVTGLPVSSLYALVNIARDSQSATFAIACQFAGSRDQVAGGFFSLKGPPDFQGHGTTWTGLGVRFSGSRDHPIFSLMGPPSG